MKINKLILFIGIILIISVTILSNQLNNLDEIWNYNFARNISNGNLPYKDFNIIQMPGLFLICSVFLKLFNNELIVMRILAIIFSTLIIVTTYKLFEIFNINKYLCYFFTLAINSLLLNYFCIDYNFFNLLILLILIFIEYKNIDNNSIKYNILIGILAGTSIIVKQTTGIFVIIICILIKVFSIIKKENIKQILKIVFMRCIGIFIPILIIILYLTINNIWKEFIDYTILGIGTFTNKVEYTNLIINGKWYIKMLAILIPVYYIYLTIRYILKKEKDILIFLGYGLASFIVVYPISDNIHFLIGAIPAVIGGIYILYNKFNLYKQAFFKERIIKLFKLLFKYYFYIIITFVIITYSIKLILLIKQNLEYKQLNNFAYIPVSESLLEKIKEVDKFILEKEFNGEKVYILDATAAIYMIPINKYNKNYDMFLKGNIGSKGELNQIEKLKNINNAYFLILTDSNIRNWQTPTKVIKFVEENFNKVGEIKSFSIYNK